MFVLVVTMLLSVVVAVAVMGLVAIPARREGREMLTPKGEEVVLRVREKTGSAVETAREKTAGAMDAARDKVTDVTRPNED
jgi:competence protein ComGC